MTCPECQEKDGPCYCCDGTGTLCDICGEPADPGAALCDECQAEQDED